MANKNWASNEVKAALGKNNQSMQTYIKANLNKYSLVGANVIDPDDITKKFTD